MKKKTVIFGAGYHGRAAFRKILSKKNLEVINWVDGNIKLKNKYLFGKKILDLQSLKKINFDQIIFCGRHINDQLKSYNKLKLSKKILKWDSFKLKPGTEQIRKRDAELYKILKDVIKKLNNNNIPYWADTSGLLTLIRKDKLSILSDFDLGFDHKYLKKIFNIFKYEKKYEIYKGYFQRKKKYPKIAFLSKNKSILFEPAVLDFTFYKKKKRTLYKFGNKRIKMPLKLVKQKKYFRYKDLNITIPIRSKEYLTHLYGKQFKTKSRFYNNPLNYKNYKIKKIIN